MSVTGSCDISMIECMRNQLNETSSTAASAPATTTVTIANIAPTDPNVSGPADKFIFVV